MLLFCRICLNFFFLWFMDAWVWFISTFSFNRGLFGDTMQHFLILPRKFLSLLFLPPSLSWFECDNSISFSWKNSNTCFDDLWVHIEIAYTSNLSIKSAISCFPLSVLSSGGFFWAFVYEVLWFLLHPLS